MGVWNHLGGGAATHLPESQIHARESIIFPHRDGGGGGVNSLSNSFQYLNTGAGDPTGEHCTNSFFGEKEK